MTQSNQQYYIGLDCGTNSVGWAVTDEKYNLLTANGRIKKDGKVKSKARALWGTRLFDEAETAAGRRVVRSNRRRLRREQDRLKLLRMLFSDEMAQVDPEFYQRLKRSFYYEEDKNLLHNSKNTLFNDTNYTDKDFHKEYPTIWHLRKAIIDANPEEHFDIRLYFLAIQHILKHRGHFLFNGEIKDGRNNFQEIFDGFCDACENVGYRLDNSSANSIEEIICDKSKGKLDKKKELKERIFIEGDELEEDRPQGETELAGLLVGSKVSLNKIFNIEAEEDYKYSFAEGVFEEKLPDIEAAIRGGNINLILAAKQIYDHAILRDLLGKNKFISDAMVANYKQHKEDLKALKEIFRPHSEIYQQLFKDNKYDKKSNKFDSKKNPSYEAYAGHSYQVEGDRSGHVIVSQEDFNNYLTELFEQIGYTGPLLARAKKGELLPKQRGQAKGTIPQQLHHNELELILQKLAQDFPSFAIENPDEPEEYNTKCKKIAKIHSFRIPYYCGPLVKRKYDDKGNLINNGRSQFSWNDNEIPELIRPWNFDSLVNKDALAENFIRRMTNECTYLLGEEVLPKSSLLYQRYMVLNELNNLRINGRPLDVKLKQEIFNRGFLKGELSGNITLRKLERYLKDNKFISSDDELSGTSEVKTLPKLKTHQDFYKILGSDYAKHYDSDKLEKVIEAITILGDEKGMLQRKIAKLLNLHEDSKEVQNLSKLSYKDWGKFSAKFLQGITVGGQTILDWLYNSQCNLQQLIGKEVGFEQVIEEYNTNSGKKPQAGAKIRYSDVQNLYCSPAVKRSVWQTIKIVDELVKKLKHAPAKIFIEVTRGEDEKSKGKYTIARKKDLEQKLKAVKSVEAQEILHELSQYDDRNLQSKKLFLYFSQMGKCAYSGEPINLDEINNASLYDIDHIYPRSKTKDDSITRNLVLVKAELNRDKTNVYPIRDDIRNRMRGIWSSWWRADLITKEKYDRLIRATPLTDDELGSFIARQIVETSQTVKAIRDLLKQAYPKTKVVMVKAGQVSDFRHLMSCDKKDRDGHIYQEGRPEFIKVRELNDFHHAKDAYLNIVVGNVMNSTFTDNPYEWVKNRNGCGYSINPERIFRDSYEYIGKDGRKVTYPETRAWDFIESIQIISDNMKRNDILWTRMNYVESGEISDLQLVGKSEKADDLLRIKNKERLNPKKYGGYNKIQGAFFALIEETDKDGNPNRSIVSVPQIYQNKMSQYVIDKYPGSEIVIPVIKYQSLFKVNGIPLYITGKTGSRFSYQHGLQLVLNPQIAKTVKNIAKVCAKIKSSGKKYKIDENWDGVNEKNIGELMDELTQKVALYEKIPSLETMFGKIKESRLKFDELDLSEKCLAICELLKVFSCGAERGNLSSFVTAATQAGTITMSRGIGDSDSVCLVNQSPTGLCEEHIDLRTVLPRPVKKLRNQ